MGKLYYGARAIGWSVFAIIFVVIILGYITLVLAAHPEDNNPREIRIVNLYAIAIIVCLALATAKICTIVF